MIINGGSRSNWRFFASHLMKGEENEVVHVTEIRGLASETVLGALREMDALASGTRCKNHFYHANINPRSDEVLTLEQWEQAVDALESNLGLEGHSRFIVEHCKDGRSHRHVIWSRINTDTMTAVSDSKNFAIHERTSRALETAFGHSPVAGVHERDGKRPKRRPKNWETFRGHESGIDHQQVSQDITALWQRSDSGQAFAQALRENGYRLCRGDRRDFCVVDQAGDAHSLARRIDGVKAAQIRKRLGDIDPSDLPTVANARSELKASPLRSSAVDSLPAETERKPTPVPVPALTAVRAFAQKVLQRARRAPRPEAKPLSTPPLPQLAQEPSMRKESAQAAGSALDAFAHQVKQVMQSNGGEPHIRDGLTWLERSITTVASIRDSAIDWAKGRWQDLIHKSRDRDDEDRER